MFSPASRLDMIEYNLMKHGYLPVESSMAFNYAKIATKNGFSSEVVLGKFDQDGVSYVKVAESRRSTYFQLDNWDDISGSVGSQNMWSINEQFLNQQMAQGKNFILTHNPYEATGFFSLEVDYLTQHGYHFVQNGSIWNAIK